MKNNSLLERLSVLSKGVQKVQVYKEMLESQVTRLSAEETEARYKSDLYQRCSESFKKLLDDSLEKNVNSMSELATVALNHIIDDQELKFSIKQEHKYNKVSMKFVIEEGCPNGIVEGDPMNSYGGAAAVIISFVLRLAVMAKTGMGNLLLLDESMFAVANAYIPNTAMFMRKLSEQTGINILMVTHNNEFVNAAHTAYEGTKDGSLKLRKINTEKS